MAFVLRTFRTFNRMNHSNQSSIDWLLWNDHSGLRLPLLYVGRLVKNGKGKVILQETSLDLQVDDGERTIQRAVVDGPIQQLQR